MSDPILPSARGLEVDPGAPIAAVIEARLAGGSIQVYGEFAEWLDETLVILEIPGQTLALRMHEAKELAAVMNAQVNAHASADS